MQSSSASLSSSTSPCVNKKWWNIKSLQLVINLPFCVIVPFSCTQLFVSIVYSGVLLAVGPGLRSCLSQGPHANSIHRWHDDRRSDLYQSVGQIWSQTDFSIQSLGSGHPGRGHSLRPELLCVHRFEIHYRSIPAGMYTVSQKKLSRFVFVRTSWNFHQFR